MANGLYLRGFGEPLLASQRPHLCKKLNHLIFGSELASIRFRYRCLDILDLPRLDFESFTQRLQLPGKFYRESNIERLVGNGCRHGEFPCGGGCVV